MNVALTPLSPDLVRARNRPLAVLFVFAAELVWALIVATPAHAWARRAWGGHPDGDAVLFLPAGRDLLAWLGQNDSGFSVTVRTTMVLLFAGAVFMQFPLGTLLASLAFSPAEAGTSEESTTTRRRPPRALCALRVGVSAFMPLVALLVLASIVTIIVISVGALTASALDHHFAERIGDAHSFTLRIVTYLLFAMLAALLGIVTDLARAAIGREVGIASGTGQRATAPALSVMVRGLRVALTVARRRALGATLAWAWRAALGLVLIAIGYAASEALSRRGDGALVALFAVHQTVVLGRTALRASWLARAIALVAAAPSTSAPSVRDEERAHEQDQHEQ